MKSKVNELGLFCVGLGGVFIGFNLYVQQMLASPGATLTGLQWALLVAPGTIVLLAGIFTLAVRSPATVKFSAGVVLAAFLIDALLVLNPIKWAITAVCMRVIYTTARDAVRELKPQSEA